jgi:hypothetical protein
MNGGMVWEEPPPAGRYDWEDIAARLQERPGDWLKVFDDGPVSVVNAIRQAEVSTLTPVRPARGGATYAGFEVRTRNNKQGPPRTATLYLRWVEEE